MRKLKQNVATAMVAVMTMTNVFSAVAGTVGTPSYGKEKIKVTFDARGGIG